MAKRYNILTRCLAAMALLFVYFFSTSAILVGAPWVSTQGIGTLDMKFIGELIAKGVTEGDADPDHTVSKEVRAQVTDLVTRFPAYPRA